MIHEAYRKMTEEVILLGKLDLSGLKACSKDGIVVSDYSANIKNITPTSLPEVKLPFNCKFIGIDLTDVESVSYDVLTVGQSTGAGIDNSVIKRVVTVEEATYGDYKNDKSLGVTTTVEGTGNSVNGDEAAIVLSDIVGSTEFNKSELKLLTDDLTTNSMALSAETTYYFGLRGDKEISVTKSESAAEGTKLVLAGDNSEYEPTNVSNVTMPDVVEFAASKSLLPFSFTYGKGVFSGSSKSNAIANGISVKFTDGMDLKKGHSLSVSGSLTL